MKIISFFIVAFFTVLFSCTSGDNKEDEASCNSIQKVFCTQDSTISYSLYLPVNYSENREWPVVFCFDPHADGQKPVELLKLAAEKYGYIIVGSLNVKNNLPNTQNIVEALWQDVLNQYSINEKRIYTCGFSGGGRVAFQLALQKPQIAGVISAGAGVQGVNLDQLQHKINYYGIAGIYDFNYLEVKQIGFLPNQAKFNHFESFPEVKHQWPSKEEMEKALLWHHFNAMRDEKLKKDKKLFKTFYNSKQAASDSLLAYEKYLENIECISFLADLFDVTECEEYVRRFVLTDTYKSIIEKEKKSISKEINLRNVLASDIQTQNVVFWTKRINEFNSYIKQEPKPEHADMIERNLQFISMLCYMHTSKALQTTNTQDLEKFLTIYQLVDPLNKDMMEFKLQYFNLIHQPDSIAYYNNLLETLGK